VGVAGVRAAVVLERSSPSAPSWNARARSRSVVATFITEFWDRIFHAHIKDSVKHLDGRSSILGGHLDFGEPGRGLDFVPPTRRRRRSRA
jgi:hypothetical protein